MFGIISPRDQRFHLPKPLRADLQESEPENRTNDLSYCVSYHNLGLKSLSIVKYICTKMGKLRQNCNLFCDEGVFNLSDGGQCVRI